MLWEVSIVKKDAGVKETHNNPLSCAYMGCVQGQPLASRTPSIRVGYTYRIHALIPWYMSVMYCFHHMGYQLEFEKFYED